MKTILQFFVILGSLSLALICNAQMPNTLELDSPEGWMFAAPQGYTQADYSFGPLPVSPDGSEPKGMIVKLDPGKGLTIYGPESLATGESSIIGSVQCTDRDVMFSLAALNVPVDGSLTSSSSTDGARFVDQWGDLQIDFAPVGNAVIPVIQVVSISDRSITVFLDSLTIIQTGLSTAQSSAQANEVLEGFETGDFSALPWENGTPTGWTVTTQAFSGSYAARSGEISHSGRSELTLTMTTAAGDFSYQYRVSSERNKDFLFFYLDGKVKDRFSGTNSWAKKSYNLKAGQHTFKWVYLKDRSGFDGEDAAFIDDIVIPVPQNPPTSTPTVTATVTQTATDTPTNTAQPTTTPTSTAIVVSTPTPTLTPIQPPTPTPTTIVHTSDLLTPVDVLPYFRTSSDFYIIDAYKVNNRGRDFESGENLRVESQLNVQGLTISSLKAATDIYFLRGDIAESATGGGTGEGVIMLHNFHRGLKIILRYLYEPESNVNIQSVQPVSFSNGILTVWYSYSSSPSSPSSTHLGILRIGGNWAKYGLTE